MSRTASPAAKPRLHIENQAHGRVVGWAVNAEGGAGVLQLWVAGRCVDQPVQRQPRADVQAHLGRTGDAAAPAFGFEAALWGPALDACGRFTGAVPVEIRLDDQPLARFEWVVTRETLSDWARHLLAADGAEQDHEWPRLLSFLKTADDAQWAWLWAAWARNGGAPGERIEARIEQVDGVWISGWARDRRATPPVFELRSGDGHWPVQAARYERSDVQPARPATPTATPNPTRPRAGFELSWPVAVWRGLGAAEEIELQLVVDARPLSSPTLRASRAHLARWLEEAERALADATPEHAAEAGQRLALLRAHARAAALPPPAAPDAVGGSPAPGPGPGPGLQAEPTPASEPDRAHLWMLQRGFNQRLGEPGASVLTAWQRLADDTDPAERGPAWRRFVLSLIPAFCAAGQLDKLRPALDDADLATLGHADSAWELSLVLPVVMLDELVPPSRWLRSVTLMERLAAAVPGGWLNTESVADAVARVHRASAEQALDDADLHAWVAALLRLYERLGADQWSRSHDRHLVDAMVALIGLAEGLTETLAREVQAAALRLYGLHAAFWRGGPARGLSTARWEAPAQAFTAWQTCFDALRADPTTASWSAAWTALQPFAAWQVHELASIRRHLLAWRPPGFTVPETADGAVGLADEDRLRVQPEGDAAATRWQRLLPTPSSAPHGLRRRLAETEQRWRAAHASPPADAAPACGVLWPALRADALVLARSSHGFVGLLALARAWQVLPENAPQQRALVAAALLPSVRHALDILERRRHQFALPPASVLATLRWLRTAGLPGGATLVDEAMHRLRAAWGDGLAQVETHWPDQTAPGWQAPLPGISVLVIVRRRAARPGATAPQGLSALATHGAAGGFWDDAPPLEPAADELASLAQADGGAQATARSTRTENVTANPAVNVTANAAVNVTAPAAAGSACWPVVRQPGLFGVLDWLLTHTCFGQFVFVDDDVQLSVDALFNHSAAAAHHFHGLIDRSASPRVDPGLGLSLSRTAAVWACQLAASRQGARWRVYLEDDATLLAELLRWVHIHPSDEGHAVHLRRPPTDAHPNGPFHNLWCPGPNTPTVLTTSAHDAPHTASAGAAAVEAWLPRRIWPPDQPPRLPGGTAPAHQLVRLSSGAVHASPQAPCVIAVARNERVLMPHFLAHYRQLGVRRFFIADNLSTDGTREYLLEQPDVGLYSVDTAYRDSHYGVAWQLALLVEHAQQSWALVADIDEFLVWPGCENEDLASLCSRLDAAGHDAALALMVDMYPAASLETADFTQGTPFAQAPWFDAQPLQPWRLGSGSYSHGATAVSAVRHRLLPDSAPNHYTAQKIPLMRYRAGVRLSEGLHYAAGLATAAVPVFFAHFKYHRGFRAKVEEEVARKQHYNDAEEYRKYRALWAEARGMMFDPAVSRRYADSHSFADVSWT